MYGIDSIEIEIINIDIKNNIFLDLNRKIVIVKNNIISIDEDIINNLLRIIRTWKHEYIKDNDIDREEYNICINTKNSQEILHGKGLYPDNYSTFKQWIGDLYVR